MYRVHVFCVDHSICAQYLERRECEYDLKTSVDFYKVSHDKARLYWIYLFSYAP